MDERNGYVSAYLDEAEEHLRLLDQLVPCLDSVALDQEDVHAAFRAMHSIKGGAAIFGQAVMADLAHVAEHVLDLLRKQHRPASALELDALSEGLDALHGYIAALRRGETPERAAPQRAIEHLAGFGVADPSVLKHDLGEFGVFAEISAGKPLQSRFAPPAPGDEDGFGFFVPLEEGAVAAPEAEFLQDANFGTAEFFVVMPGASEGPTGLPVLTRLDSKAPAKTALAAATPLPAASGVPAAVPAKPAGVGVAPATPPALPQHAPADHAVMADTASFTSPGPAATANLVPAADTVRVASSRLDGLLDLASEFSQLSGLLEEVMESDFLMKHRVEPLLDQFEQRTRDLHSAVMALRLVPLSQAFSRLPRLVRDLTQQLGKSARLDLIGADTEVDKALVERLTDPLMHLVRNALDHGIEHPQERLAAGKPAQGVLRLAAEQRAGQVVITLQDDGAGLSRTRILERALELGMVLPAGLPDAQVFDAVFAPGFSTARKISDLSGRGVGLDVVRQALLGMGGRVSLTSQPGKGACFELRLPLTLAVLDGMLVVADGDAYLLPLGVVRDSLDARSANVHTVAGGRETISLHGRPIPVFRLARLFAAAREAARDTVPPILVVVQEEGGAYALAVDELHGQHSAVVKGLEGHMRGLAGVTGSTLIGAGRTALILDPHALPRLLGGLAAPVGPSDTAAAHPCVPEGLSGIAQTPIEENCADSGATPKECAAQSDKA